jgi:hypothetical protein
MKKLWNWLKESNRWQHIAISIMIGLLFNNLIYTAICATMVGVALEYKDKAYGGKWDWIDLTLTIVPALVINGLK